jgi:hypothetical protein
MENDLPYIPEEDLHHFSAAPYNRASKYFFGDTVTYKGAMYIASRESEGETPDHNPDAWTAIVTYPLHSYMAIASGYTDYSADQLYVNNSSDTFYGARQYNNDVIRFSDSSQEIHELRAIVDQLRTELAVIKERLNAAEAGKKPESYRKIAVQ